MGKNSCRTDGWEIRFAEFNWKLKNYWVQNVCIASGNTSIKQCYCNNILGWYEYSVFTHAGSNLICQCLHFTGWWSLADHQDRRVGRWYPLGSSEFGITKSKAEHKSLGIWSCLLTRQGFSAWMKHSCFSSTVTGSSSYRIKK